MFGKEAGGVGVARKVCVRGVPVHEVTVAVGMKKEGVMAEARNSPEEVGSCQKG